MHHKYLIRQKKQKKRKKTIWLPSLVVRDFHIYLQISCDTFNCIQIQLDWHKSKLLQKKNKKNGKAELQYNAYFVNRYYCELINQAGKHSKYPVPVFVSQQAPGLRNINRACVCLFVRVQERGCHTLTNFLFYYCVFAHAIACAYVYVLKHANICVCLCVKPNKTR